MPKPFKKITLLDTEEERDLAFNRIVERATDIATGQRVIKKITRRQGNKTLYGYEIKQR